MTADQEAVERTFVFKFPTCTTKQEYKLEVPIYIPYSGSIKELTQRLISSFKLPCYVEKGRLCNFFITNHYIKFDVHTGQCALKTVLLFVIGIALTSCCKQFLSTDFYCPNIYMIMYSFLPFFATKCEPYFFQICNQL